MSNLPKKNLWKLLLHLLHRRPVLSYVLLTLFLMTSVVFLEKGARFYQASILNVPVFDGTFMPITRVPNWVKTGGKNNRAYSDYSPSELIYIPEYNPSLLQTKCDDWSQGYTNACATYTTVYMGNYKLDHKEYAGSHPATDIRAPLGTPVYAVANGVVEQAKYQGTGFGNHVVIKHPNVPLLHGGKDTLYSSYSHLSSIKISKDDMVKKGDFIGYVGSTGTSTTPHVHFQIDTSTAPYHPWWPFTSADTSAAGLSFFQGVNAALGQKEAMRNTVNPLLWVQKYLSYTPSKNTKNTMTTNSQQATTTSLASFSAISSVDKVEQNKTFIITVTAFDAKKNKLVSYNGKHMTVVASTKNVTIGDYSFSRGRALIPVSFSEYGRMKVVISDGDISQTVRIQVTRAGSNVSNVVTNTPQNIDKKQQKYNISTVELFSDSDIVLGGKNAEITVRLYDVKGKLITHPKFSSPLEIRVSGAGYTKPKALIPRYFKNGVAKIDFFAEKKEGQSQVFLTEFPNKKAVFQVVKEVSPVSGFGIESDGFLLGKKSPVFITTRDKNKNRTLRSFRGSAVIKVESGKARLSKTIIDSKDFKNGVATIEMTGLSTDPIILSVKSGVLVGTSKLIQKIREEDIIFNDVSASHPDADAIMYLKKKKILNGNPDGSFRPDGTINRAEFAKVMLLALDIDPTPAKGNRFSDVPKNAWYAEYVETAASLGIINGYPDGSFRPDGPINRAEVFAMIARASHKTLPTYSSFRDVNSNAWFAAAAEFAKQNKLLDFDTSFYPELRMTRAEVAEAVARFMKM